MKKVFLEILWALIPDFLKHWLISLSTFLNENISETTKFLYRHIYTSMKALEAENSQFDFYHEKTKNCLFIVSCEVQRFHLFLVGRTAQ